MFRDSEGKALGTNIRREHKSKRISGRGRRNGKTVQSKQKDKEWLLKMEGRQRY